MERPEFRHQCKLTDGTKPTRKNTTSFVAEVDENTTSIEIVPTAASSGAKITINGEVAASGKAYVGKLTGSSTRFVIEVTAKNGSDSKRYTLKVRQKIRLKNRIPTQIMTTILTRFTRTPRVPSR